ncbi:methionine ABC transporter ATP-binding protein [Lysinibacter cavernae]|uniref:D-methionine transport system ATP-binding protein n=1 Tax=Lysinibacter cavernae TaxID=1640652 RepID=A0A7X5R3Z9_9MICO|nr:ATP-binding cassette domain-containing protein [Lysinibacter cavernae]NIH54932.1 D-methionine transport system ATP-binding protein [Lysinibacter cavernae]
MIELRNITKVYERAQKKITALDHVDLTIDKGDIFGVIGYSGAGKSTLIRLVNFLERPTSGSVIVDGTDLASCSPSQLRGVKREIGMIFQHFNLLQSRTVAHNVAMPLILAGKKKHEIEPRVAELLAFVGLEDKGSSYPNELSGGQKQRVGIARALASNPKILLCDEATSALDPETTRSILALLQRINKELNITIVLITHEMSVIQEICNRVAVMENGQIVELGPTLDVFLHPTHPTARNFVQTVMSTDVAVEEQMTTNANERVVQLEVMGDALNEPFIDLLGANHGLQTQILRANTVSVQQTKILILVLKLSGTQQQIAEGLTALRETGITVLEVATHV